MDNKPNTEETLLLATIKMACASMQVAADMLRSTGYLVTRAKADIYLVTKLTEPQSSMTSTVPANVASELQAITPTALHDINSILHGLQHLETQIRTVRNTIGVNIASINPQPNPSGKLI